MSPLTRDNYLLLPSFADLSPQMLHATFMSYFVAYFHAFKEKLQSVIISSHRFFGCRKVA
jgi:hypothetical protein